MKRFGLAALAGATAIVLGLVWARPLSRATLPPRVSLAPLQLTADGYDTATLTIDEPSPGAPAIAIEPAHAATVHDLSATDHGWQAQIRAGVTPAIVAVRVIDSGKAAGASPLVNQPRPQRFRRRRHARFPPPGRSATTSASSAAGSPSWPRCSTSSPPERRPPKSSIAPRSSATPIAKPSASTTALGHRRASAALAWNPVRREISLSVHAAGRESLPRDAGPIPSGRPHDRRLRAVRRRQDACSFCNTHFVARDVDRALPGDLLFYRQETDHMPFHSMIYLGPSQIRKDAGALPGLSHRPRRARPGEIRRLSTGRTAAFSGTRLAAARRQSRFLGVYRWNILRKTS